MRTDGWKEALAELLRPGNEMPPSEQVSLSHAGGARRERGVWPGFWRAMTSQGDDLMRREVDRLSQAILRDTFPETEALSSRFALGGFPSRRSSVEFVREPR